MPITPVPVEYCAICELMLTDKKYTNTGDVICQSCLTKRKSNA